MEMNSALFKSLLNYRFQSKFELLTNLTRMHHMRLDYPAEIIHTISEFKRNYQKTFREYNLQRERIPEFRISDVLREPPGFHENKVAFLERVEGRFHEEEMPHKVSQIRLVARNMLHRYVYLGTPVLFDTDPEHINTKTENLLTGFEGQKAIVSFLVASVEATSTAMANNNTLRSEYVPSYVHVTNIVESLTDLNLSWLNDKIRKRIFYLRSQRGQNEIPLRYLFLEISHLLFHLSLVAEGDMVARKGLDEAAEEIRANCNRLSQNKFFSYYAELRKKMRRIVATYRYYNPQKVTRRRGRES